VRLLRKHDAAGLRLYRLDESALAFHATGVLRPPFTNSCLWHRNHTDLFTNSLSLSKDFFRVQVLPSLLGGRNRMALALEENDRAGNRSRRHGRLPKKPTPNSIRFGRFHVGGRHAGGIEGSWPAASWANEACGSLGGRITLIVPQIVPYPLPLTRARPCWWISTSERRLRVIASQMAGWKPAFAIYLCRDPLETLTVGFETSFSIGRHRKPQEVVANRGKTAGQAQLRSCWAPGCRHGKRLSTERERVLCSICFTLQSAGLFSGCLLGLHQGLRQALGGAS
jgi:hypothetical protein